MKVYITLSANIVL